MSDLTTIAAVSTPPGQGGVGLIRLSGPLSIAIGRRIFISKPVLGKRVRRVEYGKILDSNGQPIDTGLAWVLKAPRSYTGEDTLEISCHGSDVVLETLLQAALFHGAQLAAAGEFTKRAFLNGKLDLLQAEAVIELIHAGSKGDIDRAYSQASGRLSRLVSELKSLTVKALSLIEVGFDFSEEDIHSVDTDSVLKPLREGLALGLRLIETFEGTRRRQSGLLIALIGPPNAGKSTLLNALIGEDKAIVTAKPGTTRDLIEGKTVWQGETLRFVDTAGLRATEDEVEKEGVKRALDIAHSADLVFIVLDATRPWEDFFPELNVLLEKKPGIFILNKIDLPQIFSFPDNSPYASPVEISALTGFGLDILRHRLLDLIPRPNLVDGVSISKQRHRDALQRFVRNIGQAIDMIERGELEECAGVEIQEALVALAEILGERIDEDVLDYIFSEFCIGK